MNPTKPKINKILLAVFVLVLVGAGGYFFLQQYATQKSVISDNSVKEQGNYIQKSIPKEIKKTVDTDQAVKDYIAYLDKNSGSANEGDSFAFEELFAKNPTGALSIIKGREDLLDKLEWGFVNNYYGEVTLENYVEVFYKKYPSLKNNDMYKKEIEYLLRGIQDELTGQ